MEGMEQMTSEVTDEVLDSAWDGYEDSTEAASGAGRPADQPTDRQEGTDAPEMGGEQPAADQPQEKPADQPELFTLRNREETMQVGRDELIAMAQKGWDYDKVRAERDQLQQYREEAGPALDLVRGYAQKSGMSVAEYLDFCRKQELMRGGLDEQAAGQALQFEKREADLNARQARLDAREAQESSAQARAKEQAQARQRDIEAFYKAYPKVDPKSIPQEVWNEVKGGESLTNAYTRYENRRLQAELAAERQNRENRQRTPGSLGGNAAAEMDEIDRIWSEED